MIKIVEDNAKCQIVKFNDSLSVKYATVHISGELLKNVNVIFENQHIDAHFKSGKINVDPLPKVVVAYRNELKEYEVKKLIIDNCNVKN